MDSEEKSPCNAIILQKISERYAQKTENFQKFEEIAGLHLPTVQVLHDKLDENFDILVNLGGDIEKRYGEFLDQTYSLAAIDGGLAESFVSRFKDVLRFLVENPIERFSYESSEKEKIDPWKLYRSFYKNVKKVSQEGVSEGGKILVESAAEWFDYFDKEFDFRFPIIDDYFDMWGRLTEKIGGVNDGATRTAIAEGVMATVKALREKEPKPDDCYKLYCEFEYAVEKVKELATYSGTTAAKVVADNLHRIVKYPGILTDYDHAEDQRKQRKWNILDKGEYDPLSYDTPSRFEGLNLLVTRIKILKAEGKLEKLVEDFEDNPDDAMDKYFGFIALRHK